MDIKKSDTYAAPRLEAIEMTSENLCQTMSGEVTAIADWNEDDNYIDGVTF